MKSTIPDILLAIMACAGAAASPDTVFAAAPVPASVRQPLHRTENVISSMTDGFRWQDMFAGAEKSLVNKHDGGIADMASFKKRFWRDSPEARRKALLPFVWGVIARQGQIYGNRWKGSEARVTNGLKFSYPGYQETLCGFADPRIRSNEMGPNPNVSVLEWLNRKDAYRGRVAAFGAWDAFDRILNRRRCGFCVNAGLRAARREQDERADRAAQPAQAGDAAAMGQHATGRHRLPYGGGVPQAEQAPRALRVARGNQRMGARGTLRRVPCRRPAGGPVPADPLGEPRRRCPSTAVARRSSSRPTTGAAERPAENSRGATDATDIDGAEMIWLAVLGPDTPAMGERHNVPPVTQSQIAATMAAFLGEDYAAAVPRAAKPIADALRAPKKARAEQDTAH